jgi:hypothetical protein
VGIVPYHAVPGDLVCIINDCKVPFILRRSITGENALQMIGESYIYGIMEGEALSMPQSHVEDVRLQ